MGPEYTIDRSALLPLSYQQKHILSIMPFDEMRRRQQQIARRRKKKKFSLVLPQITISSPHYNNDVDIRYSNKMMKYIVYSVGKLFYCYFALCCCSVCSMLQYLTLTKLDISYAHMYLMHIA